MIVWTRTNTSLSWKCKSKEGFSLTNIVMLSEAKHLTENYVECDEILHFVQNDRFSRSSAS